MYISPENINIINVLVDGNCLYRALSRFIYGTEDLNSRFRNEIYTELLYRIDIRPHIAIEYGKLTNKNKGIYK